MFLAFDNPIRFAALLLLLASPAAAADLLLLERVEPKGGVVRLADVAAILNAGPKEIEALGRIPLMPSPAPGQQQAVRSQSIRELLAAHGVDLSGLRFRGADETIIFSRIATGATDAPAQDEPPAAAPDQTGFRGHTNAADMPAAPRAPQRMRVSAQRRERLAEQLAAELTKHVQTKTADGMLYVMGVELKEHNAATLAANRGELEISNATVLRPGRQRFVVAFDASTGRVKFPVLADIVEARPAVLVRRTVPRGTIITAADVYVAPLPTDFRPRGAETIATGLDEVIGKEAAAGLRPGDVATDGNCLPPVMVERNSIVTVTSGRGGIRVRTQAKCRREGRLGEIIEIESLDTRERYEARVIGRGQLAVLTVGGAAAQAVAQDIESLRLR